MLTARNLRKVYPAGPRTVEAVADVSLEVAPGELVALCGRSGSGKSTLLAMLGGLCRPSAGNVLLEGTDVCAMGSNALAELRGLRIGFVFQFASLLPTLRAIDNVALPALIGGAADLGTVYKRAEGLLARVGLPDRGDAYPGELSGGEQRRVALARALINDPPLLLADEPTGDLDEETEAEVLRLLLDVHRSQGKTLVLVTHNQDIARQASRVLRVHRGRIVSSESPAPPPAPAVAAPVLTAPVPVPAPAEPVPLGGGLGRFLGGFVLWLLLVVLAVAGLNYATAQYQRSRIEEKKTAQQQLEEAALFQLRADIDNIAYGPDGSYLLTLYLQNVSPDEDLFVLSPSVRGYVQVGIGWEEMPLGLGDDQAARVVRLDGKQRFGFVFRPQAKTFEELLPGYMHVRFTSTMLVSRSSGAKDGLFERTDDYYVYLKPHNADDEAILRKTKYPGKPPLWIPMPPH
jgi:putative ABC transport system ATP-binding protein/macrolide transport system ATP-binding/permease protein/lipoprotein-releasing system ATP-binding protein